MPTTPQDHKPKKATAFTFDLDGTSYSLPLATTAREQLPGRAIRDALMDGDEGQLRLGFRLLEVCDVDPAVLDAIYDAPSGECLRIMGDWLTFGDGDGASVPQS